MNDNSSENIAATIIRNAFSINDWRTLQGIATASGMNYDQVKTFVDSHPDIFESSSLTLSGSAVYKVRSSAIHRIIH